MEMMTHGGSTKLATHEGNVSAAFPTEFAIVTYVYGKPLCVRQVAEDFVGGQSNAFIHGVSA